MYAPRLLRLWSINNVEQIPGKVRKRDGVVGRISCCWSETELLRRSAIARVAVCTQICRAAVTSHPASRFSRCSLITLVREKGREERGNPRGNRLYTPTQLYRPGSYVCVNIHTHRAYVTMKYTDTCLDFFHLFFFFFSFFPFLIEQKDFIYCVYMMMRVII